MPDCNGNELRLILENLMKNRKLISIYEKLAGNLLNSITKGECARQFTPEDIISNIISKLLFETFHWNCEKATLDTFIHVRIKSEIMNIFKHERKFIPVSIENLVNESDNEDDEKEEQEAINELVQEPDFLYPDEESEQEIEISELEEIVYNLFKESVNEFCVADEILKGKRPKEIAKILGIPANEVRNTVMRIRRALFKWCNENNHKSLLRKLTRPVKKNNRGNNRKGGIGER